MGKIIVEDGLSLIQNRGVGQYTMGIAQMLDSLGYDFELKRKPFLENIKSNIIRRLAYLIWVNTIFILKLIISPNIEKVIFTSTIVPFIKIGKIEYISVLHDILSTVHPECRTKVQNLHANFATFCATRLADKIITVSNFSKQEIIKYYHTNENNIFVVNSSFSTNLNFNPNDNNKIIEKLHLTNFKYILSVATVHKHKNTQTLINAFESIADHMPDLKLVLVGQNGNCSLQVSHKNVVFAGFVSNEDLSILYKKAFIYCFPSIYEGFGTPCIDAQKYGIPLICSDIPVFREIAGAGAYFCEPNVNAFAKSLKNLIDNTNLRNEIISKGKQNITKYEFCNIKKQLEAGLDVL